MEILYFDTIDSTHLYLLKAIESDLVFAPVAIVANFQTNGVGTKKNLWDSFRGNLFLSFALDKNQLPSDLPIASSSIYFAFIMREVLSDLGSKCWLKWPNDLYIGDKKVGGTITKMVKDRVLICSMGINLKKSPKNFGILDIDIQIDKLLNLYFLKLKQVPTWKNIFMKYEIEFDKSKGFKYHDITLGKKVDLKSAVLETDGSIKIDNRKVYSLR